MTFKERAVNTAVKLLLRISCKIQIKGMEKIPLEGPAIIITNHTTNLEGPLFYISLRPRKTRALAKRELWKNLFTKMAMEAWESVPVERGGVDMKAIRSCFGVLDDGNFLCIAPEGTRSKDGALKKAMPGTTFFASRKRVPIYPMVQWGLLDMKQNLKKFRRARVHLNCGDPFIVEKTGGGKIRAEDREKMADEMMFQLADLLPEELRGYYSDSSRRTSEFVKPL